MQRNSPSGGPAASTQGYTLPLPCPQCALPPCTHYYSSHNSLCLLCPCMSCKPPTKHDVPLSLQKGHPNSRFPRSVDKYCAFFSPRFAAKNDFAVFGLLQPFCGVAEGACFCMLYRSVQSTNGRIEICRTPPAIQVMAGESFGGGRHLTPDFG